jgi:hypothetical protein
MLYNNKKLISRLGFALFFIAMNPVIMAQEAETEEEMITDRPDATESPRVVPRKSIQIETGFFYESFKEQQVQNETIGYNTTLLRYGVLDNFEMRLGWNFEEGVISENGIRNQDVSSGYSPLLLGMKIEIIREKGLMPDIGFLGHVSLPFFAGSDYRPETTGVDFRFSFGHTLSEKSSIGYNLGAQWGNDSSEASYVYTFAYGYSILEKLGAYIEIYGDFPEDNKATHYWDSGFTYNIKNNIQVDATVGQSFGDGQDILLSAGVSYRFPN